MITFNFQTTFPFLLEWWLWYFHYQKEWYFLILFFYDVYVLTNVITLIHF